MPSHFVVHTQPNCEKRAFDRLKSQDFAVYCPMTLHERRHARRVEFVPRPFFQRYMFVQDDARGVSLIKRTYGVSDVVRAGLEPLRVSQDIVDGVKAREDSEGFIMLRKDQVPGAFRQGELLRVTDGAYEGYNVLFQQMRGDTRALVFLTLMQQQFKATVPVASLERAA